MTEPAPRAALVVLCAASFLAVADTTIVSIAVPTIRRELGFSAGGVQWVLNAYTLVFAGMLLLFGRIADRSGRRRAFLAGLVVFGVGSFAAAVAPDAATLVTARFGQGLGAAAFVPSSLSLLTTTFATERARGRALAAYGAMAGLGFVFGMVGGGVITQVVGWRGIFWINLPIVAALLAASPRVLGESRGDQTDRRLDVAGALTVTAGLVGVVYALTSGPVQGWASPSVWGIGAVGCAALALFPVAERRQQAPLVPLPVVLRRAVLTPNGAVVLESMVGIAWLYLLTLYFQDVHGMGALRTGALFAPMTLASVAGAAVAGRAVTRYNIRTVALGGVALVAAGLAGMALCTPLAAGVSLVVVGMVVGEFGFMLCSVALTMAATASLGDSHAGLAAGLFNTSAQLGAGLGLAVVATVVAASEDGGAVTGRAVQYGFLTCFAFAALAAGLIAARLRT